MMIRFWSLTIAAAVSKMGNQLLYIAIPWAVLENSQSPLLAIISLGIQAVPYALSPFIGVIIDKYDRRYIFTFAEVIQGFSIAFIPIVLTTEYWYLLFIFLFITGVGGVVSSITSDYGLLPSLVPKEKWNWANSKFSTFQQFSRFAGPGIGGFLLGSLGAAWCIWIDAISFLVSGLVVLFLPFSASTNGKESNTIELIKKGLRTFRDNPRIIRLTISLTIYNLGTGGIYAFLLTVLGLYWGWDAKKIGIVLSFGAIAGGVGTWFAPTVFQNKTLEKRIYLWLLVCMIGVLVMLWPSAYLIVLGYAILCLGEGGMNVTSMTYRQIEIDRQFAGRVNSIIRMFVFGSIPLSAVILGWISEVKHHVLQFFPILVFVAFSLFVWKASLRKPSNNQGVTVIVNNRSD